MERIPQPAASTVDQSRVDLTGGRGAKAARYAVRRPLDLRPGASPPWTDQLLRHFLRVGKGPNGAARLVDSSDAVVRTLCQALEVGRWEPALALAQVAAPAFALAARWGAWAATLEVGQRAAQELGDKAALSWALHDRGVRAMALGHLDEARQLLSTALEIREELDCADASHEATSGAERTRDQLAQLEALSDAPS